VVRVTAGDITELRTVRLLRIPLPVQMRSTEHFDGLMREFALIAMDADRDGDPSSRHVPARLLDLVAELTQQYSSFTADVTAERDAAIARGESEIDLTYRVPVSVVDATRRLEVLLDEVDDYCRSGQHLITLETPPESRAFREWYLSEFVAQIEQGRDPVPWPDHVAEHHRGAEWASEQTLR
jgi:hypothetical protein